MLSRGQTENQGQNSSALDLVNIIVDLFAQYSDSVHLPFCQHIDHDLCGQTESVDKGLYKVKLKEEITLTFTVLPNIDIEVYPMKT